VFSSIKKIFIKFSLIITVLFLIIWLLYEKCASCAFFIDRNTLLKNKHIPIPKYTSINMLVNSSMGYTVYFFKDIKGWENNFKPNWNKCKVTFGKDVRFDIPYKQYIHSDISKLSIVNLDEISLVYIQKGREVYIIILSTGAGPANNVTTKIKTLNNICKAR